MQKLSVSYNTIKQVLNILPSYYIQQGDGSYHLFSIGEFEQITSIIKESSDIEDFENNYKVDCVAVSSMDDAIVLGKIANSIPFVGLKNEDSINLISSEPRTGKELILVTHNFCDPTTWYTDSVRIENDALIDSGDGYSWTSSHINWIDMTHGKLFDEDSIILEVEHNYTVIIKVDGYEKQQREPFFNNGGDYDVNYETGTITFFENQAGKNVIATYSYENGSTWKLIPLEGKRIDIEQAEAQFSSDVILNDSIVFDIYVYNPFDLPNKVLYNRAIYKKMTNFIDEAIGSFPVVPAIGGPIRGTANSVYGFPFRYGTVRKILASQGVELHVKLKNDIPFDGEFATATFYTTVRNE